MFKLIEIFAIRKDPFAPQIFKSLIFALISNSPNSIMRETYLANMRHLFGAIRTIPIALLVDPIVRIHMPTLAFEFLTFDFDFFMFVSQHPKLTIDSALLTLDLLAKIHLSSVTTGRGAKIPLLKLIERFIDQQRLQDWVQEFVTTCLGQYLGLVDRQLEFNANNEQENLELGSVKQSESLKDNLNSNTQRVNDRYGSSKQARKALVPTEYQSIKSKNKKADLLDGLGGRQGSGDPSGALYHRRNKSEMSQYQMKPIIDERKIDKFRQDKSLKLELQRDPAKALDSKLKKRLIIQILIDIIKLTNKTGSIKNSIKDKLLKAQFAHESLKKSKSKGIEALLQKLFEDNKEEADQEYQDYYNQYNKEQKALALNEENPYESANVQTFGNSKAASKNQQAGHQLGSLNHKSGKYSSLGAGRGVLVPLTERKKIRVASLENGGMSARTVQELEDIKQLRKYQELEIQKKKERDELKLSRTKQGLSARLRLRRIQLGVPQNVGGVKQEIQAVIINEPEALGLKNPLTESHNYSVRQSRGSNQLLKNLDSAGGPGSSTRFRRKRNHEERLKEIELIDLKEEEQYDQVIINEFMKKYMKLWKMLFSSYQHSGYVSKPKDQFDEIKHNNTRIFLPEVIMMLKDHDICKQLLNQEEIGSLIRQINIKQANQGADVPPGDLYSLNFQQFQQFIQQLAFFCFQRPPNDLSHFPLINQLKALLNHLKDAAASRGKPTALYTDPDAVDTPFTDKEVLRALNAKAQQDPDYEPPEGYKKQVERTPSYSYQLPQCVKDGVRESQAIGTELMDEILHEALGIHFLEPLVRFEEKVKIVPTLKKRNPLSTDKKSNLLNPPDTSPRKQSLAAPKSDPYEIKPQIRLSLKLEIAKKRQKERPHYTEVAETFEEILQATENGQAEGNLAPRERKNQPHSKSNPAQQWKIQKQQDQDESDARREKLRKQRAQEIKNVIQETNYGGRGMATKEFNKAQKDKRDKETKEKKTKDDSKRSSDLRKTIEKKQKKAEEERAAKEEEEKRTEDPKKKEDAKKRKEFMEKAKKKMSELFKEQVKARIDLIEKQDQQKALNEEGRRKLRDQQVKFYNESKDKRDQEKQESKQIDEFLLRADVQKVFNQYQKSLQLTFKHFAMQDGTAKGQSGFGDADQLGNLLNQKEFQQLCNYRNITHELVTADEVVLIYKSVVRGKLNARKTDNDQQDDASNPRGQAESNMLDYEDFKRALVRITVRAQKQGREDGQSRALSVKKEKALKDMQQKDQQKKAAMIKLRAQFDEEQRQKEEKLSKAPAKPADKEEREMTLAEKEKREEKRKMLQEAKKQEADNQFQKWLKQRENLGLDNYALPVKDDQNTADASQHRSSVHQAKQLINARKDPNYKQTKDLDKANKTSEKLTKMKFENIQVRKTFDVSLITADDIEQTIKKINSGDKAASESEVNSVRSTTGKKRAESKLKGLEEIEEKEEHAQDKSAKRQKPKLEPQRQDEDDKQSQDAGKSRKSQDEANPLASLAQQINEQ